MTTTHDLEPAHRSSATARVIENLELYGYQPSGTEPDPRPLPEPDLIAGAISDLFDILAGALRDTSLEPDLDELFWHLTDLFHKKAARVQRQLEDNEDRQKKSQDDTGRLRSALGRTRTPDRRRPSPHRAPRSLRTHSRSCRRTL